MIYKPVTAVWELTMGCNLRCKHCGSSCKRALPDELTTEEALNLCDDIGKLKLKWITLSGGEPLTRNDWHLIAKRLKQNNVVPNMITNGWSITENTLDKAVESGIGVFAISLDGVKGTHDFIRKEGSFDRIMSALDLIKKKNLIAGIVTTINKKNLTELHEMKQLLIDKGVTVWQVQIGLPMGNFAENKHMLIEPEEVDELIDFSFHTINDPRINIFPADGIGYYNLKEIQLRSKAYQSSTPVLWHGCTAGKRSFGILHNGDVLGCTSIRDKQFVEGNIRNTSLVDIWNDQERFSWSRNITKESLKGLCHKCKYGDTCLGGCPNTRLTLNGNVHSENKYCSYNVAMSKASAKLQDLDEVTLSSLGKKISHSGNLQLAEVVLSKAIEKMPNDIDLLNYYGYISFMLGNYNDAVNANENVLKLAPQNIYANNGMGLSLAKLGKINEGIQFLRKSADLTSAEYMDPYHDLALLLIENDRINDAINVIEEGKQKSSVFAKTSANLYNLLSTKKVGTH